MDALLRAAARAVSAFDPVEALKHVALRDDAPALALRGVAMAQLGEFGRARKLLARAATVYGAENPPARARCLVAEAEIALEQRELTISPRTLDASAKTLRAHGDVDNGFFAELQLARRSLLLGKANETEGRLAKLRTANVSPRLLALAELVRAETCVRQVHAKNAALAIERARDAARRAAIPGLSELVDRARENLKAPIARLYDAGDVRAVALADVERLFLSDETIFDGCRRELRRGKDAVSLVSRPVLLKLALALGEAGPVGASRETLAARAFGARTATESVRVRLRVEIGRLRRIAARFGEIRSTLHGFAFVPLGGARVLVLAPPDDGEPSAVLSLLRSGESWSTSALAAATGKSQRAVQRALAELESDGRAVSAGRGRSQRWAVRAPSGFATTLLLVAPPPRG